MWHKKGLDLKDVTPFALLIIVSMIGVSVGSQVLDDIKEGQCTYGFNADTHDCANATGGDINGISTIASNATSGGLQGLETFGSWMPTITLVVAASIIIGILVFSFARGR